MFFFFFCGQVSVTASPEVEGSEGSLVHGQEKDGAWLRLVQRALEEEAIFFSTTTLIFRR